MRSLSVSSLFLLFLCALVVSSCGGSNTRPQTVVIYTAHDREFSEPILRLFEERTGIRVQPVYDTEAVKTVGLVNRLIAERDRPACDVFWNNEIVHSLRLKREGLTQPYHSPSAERIPDSMKDPDGHWAGFGARGRVFMVNTRRLPDESTHPSRLEDLVDPRWNGRFTFAKPIFGTTATHAAVTFTEFGNEEGLAFWRAMLDNGVMNPGNAQARDAVAAGELDWCMTDTDDAYASVVDGAPVRIVYPDSQPDQRGMLMIPNTVVLINGAPNPDAGRQLIDFLLSEEVEALLARSRAAQVPVRSGVPGPEGLPPLDDVRFQDVDWQRVADVLVESQAAMADLVN